MSPEDAWFHNKPKMEIGATLHFLAKQDDSGDVFGDRMRVYNEMAGLSTARSAH